MIGVIKGLMIETTCWDFRPATSTLTARFPKLFRVGNPARQSACHANHGDWLHCLHLEEVVGRTSSENTGGKSHRKRIRDGKDDSSVEESIRVDV